MEKLKSDITLYRGMDKLFQYIFRILPQNNKTEKWALKWSFKFRALPKVVKLRTGELMKVDPTDYLQGLIYYFGMFEPQCIKVFKSLISEGDVVFDIGGNIGLYSIVGSPRVGESGYIYTFEPALFHCETIKYNIELNRFKNVAVIQSALSDFVGHINLSLPKGSNKGGYTIADLDTEEAASLESKIKVTTLDEFIREEKINLAKLSLIKMDIEGAETLALKGMSKVLDLKPSLLMEVNDTALVRFNSNSEDLCGILNALGYKGWIIELSNKLTEIKSHKILFAETIWIHPENKRHMRALKRFIN